MEHNVYVGTYTHTSESKGIYLCRFNDDSGKIEVTGYADHARDPSFLVDNGKYVYSVCEAGASGISAYSKDGATGALTLLNEKTFPGEGACNIHASGDNRWLIVANYNSGNLICTGIKQNGSVGDLVSNIQHVGSGANRERQEHAHVHCAIFDKEERFVLVADLGTNAIHSYRFNHESGELLKQGITALPDGEGPRHIILDAQNRFAYVVTELGNRVFSYAYSKETGALQGLMSLSTLPDGWKGESYCADIHLSRDGKYLYTSNRGHDSITCFRLTGGKMDKAGIFPCGGKTPRNFAVTEKAVIVANQDSDNIVVWKREEDSGFLTDKLSEVKVPMPVCVEIAR